MEKITPEIRERLMNYCNIDSDKLDVILDCNKELPKPNNFTAKEFVRRRMCKLGVEGEATLLDVKLYDGCGNRGWDLSLSFKGMLSGKSIIDIGKAFGDNYPFVCGNPIDILIDTES